MPHISLQWLGCPKNDKIERLALIQYAKRLTWKALAEYGDLEHCSDAVCAALLNTPVRYAFQSKSFQLEVLTRSFAFETGKLSFQLNSDLELAIAQTGKPTEAPGAHFAALKISLSRHHSAATKLQVSTSSQTPYSE
jgi:hypothetical protein